MLVTLLQATTRRYVPSFLRDESFPRINQVFTRVLILIIPRKSNIITCW
jgi:hypothetical protein